MTRCRPSKPRSHGNNAQVTRGALTAIGLAGPLAIAILTSCVTSQVMVGKARPPILADQVEIYLETPTKPYDKIAMIQSSSKHSFSFTSQGKTEAVIRRLKRAAAKLGANGVLLRNIEDQAAASVSGGVGTTNYSSHGDISLGFMGFTSGSQKSGNGLAIYVAPDQPPNSQRRCAAPIAPIESGLGSSLNDTPPPPFTCTSMNPGSRICPSRSSLRASRQRRSDGSTIASIRAPDRSNV